MIDLVYENQTGAEEWPEGFFNSILSHVLRYLEEQKLLPLGRQVEVGVHLITPERSQELNRTHRQKDKPTDVLSFPQEEHTLEKYGILPIGDIFICLDIARSQATETNTPLPEELTRLTVHGFLHLIGYDHEISDENAKKMFDLEEEIMKEISNS